MSKAIVACIKALKGYQQTATGGCGVKRDGI